MARPKRFDVIVVGGGPAGLSAAMVLARACRSVLVLDEGRPRNAAASAIHGFLSRDGTAPLDLVALGRREALHYGARLRRGKVVGIFRRGAALGARLANGERFFARRMLIATGVQDRIPALPGLGPLYGKSVHHCPYCDGWEWRGRALAAYGRGRAVAGLAHSLLTWSDDVAVVSNGPSRIPSEERARLAKRGVAIHEARILRLEGRDGKLQRIVFEDQSRLRRAALFFSTGNHLASSIAVNLGCRLTAKGALWVDHRQCTNVAGLFVAGDASRDVQFVVVAAAEGAKAAVWINAELQAEELARESRARRSDRGVRLFRNVAAGDPETRPVPD
jgi:thioredoxin reductase